MTSLLILQCGNKKRSKKRPLPAVDMYRSPPIRFVALSRMPSVEVYILSAEYGLIPDWKEIDPYDRIIDEKRANELMRRGSNTRTLIEKLGNRKWDETLALCNTLYFEVMKECDPEGKIKLYKGTWFQQMHRLKAFIERHSAPLVRS